jgi:uncharacterized protein involved in exopolysaccharide biosynthesis
MVAGLALVVGGLVAVRSLQQTPVYEATASVLVRAHDHTLEYAD